MDTGSDKEEGVYTSDEGRGSGWIPPGEESARKFQLLLERFPRADGEPWRAVEIEAATNKRVSSSYISALRRGHLNRPGIEKLSLIADVLGVPFELWRLEPELWDEEIEKHRGRGLRGVPERVPWGTPRIPVGEELQRRVEALFESKRKDDGEPYSEEEIAARSRGLITVEEISRMRRGEQARPPAEITLVGLSNAFDIPFRYWHAGDEPSLEYDTEALERMLHEGYVIRHRQEEFSPAERNMLEMLFAALESRRAANPPPSEGGADDRS